MKVTYYIIYKQSFLDSNKFCYLTNDLNTWSELINEAYFFESKEKLEQIISSLNEKSNNKRNRI